MNSFDLDQPVFEFSTTNENAVWTLRHAVEGIQIFGGIGSGKSSGSAHMLALKCLKKGMGGLVLTVKADEKLAWIEYCRLTNKLDDLIVIEPKGQYRFNFLEYESAHTALSEANTDNIVQVLKTVIRAGEQQSNKGDDPFWETALDMLIFNLIDLCRMAYGTLSVQTMYDIVYSMPKNTEDPNNAKGLEKDNHIETKPFNKAYDAAHAKVMKQVNSWWASLSEAQQKLYDADEELYARALLETLPDVAFFLAIGIVLALLHQTVGMFIIISSLFYSLSYYAAYYLGDEFIMDKIDELICNEELIKSFVDEENPIKTRGFNAYGRGPVDPEMRRKVVDSFFEEGENAEVR